ncbi:MAG TPA: hypothetical protein ENG74_02635 [Thermoplasmatales archaeon]|nr:hypothetical protein [Thermoplasmatales archaeon]
MRRINEIELSLPIARSPDGKIVSLKDLIDSGRVRLAEPDPEIVIMRYKEKSRRLGDDHVLVVVGGKEYTLEDVVKDIKEKGEKSLFYRKEVFWIRTLLKLLQEG